MAQLRITPRTRAAALVPARQLAVTNGVLSDGRIAGNLLFNNNLDAYDWPHMPTVMTYLRISHAKLKSTTNVYPPLPLNAAERNLQGPGSIAYLIGLTLEDSNKCRPRSPPSVPSLRSPLKIDSSSGSLSDPRLFSVADITIANVLDTQQRVRRVVCLPIEGHLYIYALHNPITPGGICTVSLLDFEDVFLLPMYRDDNVVGTTQRANIWLRIAADAWKISLPSPTYGQQIIKIIRLQAQLIRARDAERAAQDEVGRLRDERDSARHEGDAVRGQNNTLRNQVVALQAQIAIPLNFTELAKLGSNPYDINSPIFDAVKALDEFLVRSCLFTLCSPDTDISQAGWPSFREIEGLNANTLLYLHVALGENGITLQWPDVKSTILAWEWSSRQYGQNLFDPEVRKLRLQYVQRVTQGIAS
ncbi:hypothetical protein BT63DRAFT_96991 [Microthyrium microscopicum]|uniref:Uncharacterized protein n=1 Tax=Microthyrium microscopicum TaxID=703497 RepID=A0A6A6TZ93_9PEZI|nr:hypothetical protein BT63DRAFT_96991 [Microthyrium microscopicum]